MSEALLKAEKINKSFGQKPSEVQVLKEIDLEIMRGDFTIIMGSSGAGKSTLLYVLSGMNSLSSGSVTYEGKEMSGLSENQLAEFRKNVFGFIFQQTHLVSNLSLFENVAVAGYVNGSKKNGQVQERAHQLLEQMHVTHAEQRLPAQVSGGEGQRAAIARALINEPGLIFADEPTGALNRSNTDEILDILSHIHETGQSIVMVTHDVRAALRGNRILYLEDGKLVDEKKLSSYKKEDAKSREEEISSWLAGLHW